MTTQNNNIQNNKIEESVEEFSTPLDSLQPNKYEMYITEHNVIHLFVEKKEFHLTRFNSGLIVKKMKDLYKTAKRNIDEESEEKEIKSVEYTHYLNMHLVSEINNNHNYVYLETTDKESSKIIKSDYIEDVFCLNENAEYLDVMIDSEIKYLMIDGNEEAKIKISSKFKSFIDELCEIEDNKVYCNYNDKRQEAQLNIITGQYDTFKGRRFLKLNVEVVIDEKAWTFVINDSVKIPPRQECEYNIVAVYIVKDRNPLGYDYMLNKWIDISNYIDRIEKIIPSNKKAYRYIMKDGEKKGIRITKHKNSDDESVLLTDINIFNTKGVFDDMLDVDLFKTNKVVREQTTKTNLEEEVAPREKPKRGRKANK